ncbi:nucleotidyltransferase domain-containing protein [Nocardioides rubriscoriae]|uniref:nucleotidyltransferase domain-containing protein n=1 Tax=Nocardioides rubriscoriae TaxID=642762 RepID=UPI0011E06267|nr:hypothetical protein [Nocardioides rubriscoriae]
MPDDEFFHWYGAWEPLDPSTIGAFMAGFDRPWWIIGGWTIHAFTGVEREHDDLDVSMFADDAEAFRLFLHGRWTPWNVHLSWLRPFDGRFTDLHPESQLWVREHSGAPWVLDVPLTLSTAGPDGERLWTNKRFHDHVAPLDDVTWVADDGLRHLRPEVTLMMKARLDRAKDRADLEAALPLLDEAARSWLWGMVERAHPGHPWLAAYAG